MTLELSLSEGLFSSVEVTQNYNEGRRTAAANNGSRQAVCEIQQVSKGVGQYRVPKPLPFPILFRTQPHFTDGSAVISGPDMDLYRDPIGRAGVYAWTRNDRGYYTGAFVWLRVECETLDGSEPDPKQLNKSSVMHYLTFTGVGTKLVNDTSGALQDALDNVKGVFGG